MTDLNNLSVGELQTMIENAESALKNKQVSQRKEVFAQIKVLADSVGVSVEIHETSKKQKRMGVKVAPKYRNPDDASQTWTGRGLMPKWIGTLIESGRDKSEFLI
ncbi:MAG: H-NS histone family protein [Gammaproteobacteria bacterium]|jgi:DNA-binding protein H-NS|nr:H-NS histone family protein [Gammaproteobacteria bacterium]MBT4145643.1 H-NS histone family protein [Gammaproteobacteria bacterium]MBT5221741.1 H-NS histone family protein [Gammaproteobacteria bacterium]MBT5826443.1 H-NS histone family protein [Gammaproteobacteria bacterium]MBT5967014.1 H-NS histone family protein [Gammaproteobacteria bacterium]